MVALFNDPFTETHLVGHRVYLRPPLRVDYDAWAGLRAKSRAFLTPWEPSWANDALTKLAYRRRLKRINDEWRDDAAYSFHLFNRHDDGLLGAITLRHVRRGVAQSASVGYWIGEAYAGRGYMADGLRTLVHFAFDELGLHRIEAACLPRNQPSRGLLAKIGFVEEGIGRRYLKINGAWEDHVLFALMREDLAVAEQSNSKQTTALGSIGRG